MTILLRLVFAVFGFSFLSNMSLNVLAAVWNPAIAENKTITDLVNLANSPHVWAKTYGRPGIKIKPCTSLSDEEALLAVQQHPGILEMLPERQRTYEVVLAAMRTAPKEAIKNYNRNGENFPLLHAPLEHRDEAVCLAGAVWCNRALWFWPPAMRNKEMYLKAMRLNPTCIDTIPEPFCDDPEILALAPPHPVFYFKY